MQDLQMHPVKDKPLHIDFLELQDDKKVKVMLPLRTTGSAIGVMNGGKLRQPYRKLKVLGLPADLPEAIVVDITKLRIGHTVKINSLPAENIEFLDPQTAVVLSVKMARGAVEEEEEEEELEGEGEGAGEATEEAATSEE